MIRAIVCPNPPVLVAQAAPGGHEELERLRAMCDRVVTALVDDAPDKVIVIGRGAVDRSWSSAAGGTLAAYGLEVHAGGPTNELPLSLTIGAWLLDRAGWTGNRCYTAVTGTTTNATATTYESAAAETELDDVTAKDTARIGVLVMADGSAKRGADAPGDFDPGSEAFDASIGAALASGDTDALASLDEEVAAQLWVSGSAALKCLAHLTKGAAIEAQLLYDEAPFGVGYWVADWRIT